MSSDQSHSPADNMTSPSSPRPDSAVAMFEAEIANLKTTNEQLQLCVTASQQECAVWQQKHCDEKNEVFRLSGLSAKHAREGKQHEDRYSDLESKCADQTKENSRLQDALGKAQARVREAELRAETLEDTRKSPKASPDRSTTIELESLRSQVIDLQQECSRWKQIHADSNCQWAIENAMKQVTHTEQLLEASRLETEPCFHLGEAAEHMNDQNEIMQGQLMDALRDLRKREAQVDKLTQAVEAHRTNAFRAEGRVVELEAELYERTEQPSEDLKALLGDLNDSDSNHSQEISSDFSSAVPANSRPVVTASINVNVQPSTKQWALLKRVQSAISGDTKLDISGPLDLVADFIADMNRVEADHAEQTDAAAHWMSVANKGLAEVDALRSDLRTHPACVVKGHRSMADELEAKEVQLQIQAQQLAHMQKQVVAASQNH